MAKLRSKPTETTGLQWDGTEASGAGIAAWVNSQGEQRALFSAAGDYIDAETNEVKHAEQTFVVLTPNSGWVTVSPNDWVILDAKGFPYPCDPDVFEKRWEVVDG